MESNQVIKKLFVKTTKSSMEDLFSIKATKMIIKLGGMYPIGNDKLQFLINGAVILGLYGTFIGVFTQGVYFAISIASGDINVSFDSIAHFFFTKVKK